MGRLSKLTLADITSGLPEDSKDADERVLAKREAERKGRVAAAKRALAEYVASHGAVFPVRTHALASPPSESSLESRATGPAPREVSSGTVLPREAYLPPSLGPVSWSVLASRALSDQTKLTQFCARFSVTPQEICPHQEDLSARVAAPGSPRDGLPDLSSKVGQVLPREPVKTVRVWSGERALSVCTWCHGWHGWKPRGEVEDLEEVLAAPYDRLSEVRAREAAELPYDPEGDGAGWGVRGGFARA